MAHNLWLDRSGYLARLEKLRGGLGEGGLDALLLSLPANVFYFTGACLDGYERPIVALIPRDGEPFLFIPALEREHAREVVPDLSLREYFEYPGKTPPLEALAGAIEEAGLATAKVGYDSQSALSRGARDKSLCDYLPKVLWEPCGLPAGLRLRKDPFEIACLEESARWGEVALSLLLSSARPGLAEFEVSLEVSRQASRAMLASMGPEYRFVFGFGPGPAYALLTTGPATAYPHPLSANRILRHGDSVVCGVGATVAGYGAELERTFFLGSPSSEQRHYFDQMTALQDFAVSALQPGRRAAEVERDIRQFAACRGLESLLRHRTGHGLGIEVHEPPWLDEGDETVLGPGMVVSCEPGLYVPGLGGFRHSDTILITGEGPRNLTGGAPRSLASMTIPC